MGPQRYFYPRSPCGERQLPAGDGLANAVFLSTLSLRRATGGGYSHFIPSKDFYPRSPCGERRYSLRHSAQNRHFYPRSPCGERRFQLLKDFSFLPIISIHALLAESDHNTKNNCIDCCISIHALLAESDKGTAGRINGRIRRFLSTLSLRRATVYGFCTACVPENISIHALLAESDDRK